MLKFITKTQIALNERLTTLEEREDGAAMVEYGLLVALIAVVAMVAVKLLGEHIDTAFAKIAAAI